MTFDATEIFKKEEVHDFSENWIIPELDIMFKKIEPGTFTMGSNNGANNERPAHRVHITKPYWFGVFPVTQENFKSVMGKNPSNFKGEQLPVEKVSWHGAKDFCEKLTNDEREAGRLPEPFIYRLPTEAEWELVASQGIDKYFIGEIDLKAWYYKNSNEQTHEVGLKDASLNGFFDLYGNVFEWCLDGCDFKEPDWFRKGNILSATFKDDVINPFQKEGSNKIAKGGAWLLGEDLCKPSSRYINPPDSKYFVMGFRIVLGEPVPNS